MDIYQIWTTYNKQWSRYEILAFTGVLILVCTAMAVCVHRKKLNIIQAAASESLKNSTKSVENVLFDYCVRLEK